MKTDASMLWLFTTVDAIRAEAGRDAARLEALSLNPALAQEAAARFPDDPILYQQLRVMLETDVILARHGVFLIDFPLTDDL